MSIKSSVRRFTIKLLSIFGDRDRIIVHHWTRRPLRLNLFRHRGYWWKGKNRERETIEAIYRLIKPGDMVVELGGHIGYLSQIFADLAGTTGKVVVFEPSVGNSSYLKANVGFFDNVEVIEKAVGNEIGEVVFYEEGLSGQNNSLIREYDIFEHNRSEAGVEVKVMETRVSCTTLDHECTAVGWHPSFIKIDVEGAELMALQGALAVLKSDRPLLMVEISNNISECFALLDSAGYDFFKPNGAMVVVEPGTTVFNIFAFPRERTVELLRALDSNANL